MASVAFLDATGSKLWAAQEDAPQSASSACMSMLANAAPAGFGVEDADLFVADLGPGSFTGVRVGIVLAKTFGFLFNKPCAGADAFDLIALDKTVVVPLKRAEYFVRIPGQAPHESKIWPAGDAVGYGSPDITPTYPRAKLFGALLGRLELVSPEQLVPRYLLEPSISLPKRAAT